MFLIKNNHKRRKYDYKKTINTHVRSAMYTILCVAGGGNAD